MALSQAKATAKKADLLQRQSTIDTRMKNAEKKWIEWGRTLTAFRDEKIAIEKGLLLLEECEE